MQQVNPYTELKENAGLLCHPTVTLNELYITSAVQQSADNMKSVRMRGTNLNGTSL
jgi:hypothetical protein